MKIEANTNITIKPSDLYDETIDHSGYIGKPFGWNSPFYGEMDDFRIYDVALNEEQVAALVYEDMTDTQIVTAAKDDLKLEDTDIITQNIKLPTSIYGTDIRWKSSDTSHLDNNGNVTRPLMEEAAIVVDLTATITKNDVSHIKDYAATILPMDAAPYKIEINASEKGADISPYLFGLFFEDINYALDGGLYPELVQNKSFEYLKSEDDAMVQTYAGLHAWYKLERGGGVGSITTASTSSIHPNNPNYLRITATTSGTGVGVYNTGFPDAENTSINPTPSMNIAKNELYNFSLYARSDYYTGPIEVSLTSADGVIVYAKTLIEGVTSEWNKLSCVLQPNESTSTARLQILMKDTGVLDIDMVSLFPQKTWKNRENGVRHDLGKMLYDMKPKFFRFPGGCLVEGRVVSNRYQWKDTVGPLEERKNIHNNWAFTGAYPYYNQSNSFGFYEYFVLSKDLEAEPIPCISAGISHPEKGSFKPTTVPLDEMDELVQDAIDLVDFANSTDMNNKWAKLRADMGHPEPFNMKYLEIGNENGGDEYYERYKLFSDALRRSHPNIKLIVSGGFGMNDDINLATWERMQKGTIDADIVDDHYYIGSEVFYEKMNQYDNYDRNLGTVFVGEYASWGNALHNGLAEATYMTHLVENGDVVELAAYAPLFAKRNYTQWGTDAIFFDNTSAYGTVNYYVQKLFMKNTGDITLTSEIIKRGNTSHKIQGAIGLGSKNTAVEFSNVKVIDNNSAEVIFRDDFSSDGSDWTAMAGTWAINDGVFAQTNTSIPNAHVYTGHIRSENYTLTLKARKTSGAEGILINLGQQDPNNYLRLNLGGWGNTKSGFEKIVDGRVRLMTPYYDRAKYPIVVDNQWYEIKLIVTGNRVKCYINNELQFDIIDRIKSGPVYCVVSKENTTGDIIVKVTNPQNTKQMVALNFNNIDYINPIGLKTVLKGNDLNDANTFDNPRNIVPVTVRINAVSGTNKVELEPYSFTIFRLSTVEGNELEF